MKKEIHRNTFLKKKKKNKRKIFRFEENVFLASRVGILLNHRNLKHVYFMQKQTDSTKKKAIDACQSHLAPNAQRALTVASKMTTHPYLNSSQERCNSEVPPMRPFQSSALYHSTLHRGSFASTSAVSTAQENNSFQVSVLLPRPTSAWCREGTKPGRNLFGPNIAFQEHALPTLHT